MLEGSLLSQLVIGLVVSFVSVGLKGFQHKNVIGNNRRLIVVTSYFMATIDVYAVGLIAKNGLIMAIPVGTGAALGMLCAMIVHDKFIKPR